MLSLENIGLEFSGKWLLREASHQFLPGELIGLIGRNGAGKSTLLKVISGELLPSEGKVHKSGQLSIAFFNQNLLSYQTERSIFEVAQDAFADLIQLQQEMEQLFQQMESGKADPSLADEITRKQSIFDARGGPQMEAKIHATLAGLGFQAVEHHASFQTFSGGWRMRVLLAKMLLMEPDILLLDEPTNHLDLPSIQWLEGYLKGFPGTCILVSHDRFFMDRMAERILEISFQKLELYSGNYAFYLKEKAQRQEMQQRAYENQQKFLADQEKFIERFRYKATKARQVQSKIKQLDKLDRIEAPEEENVSLSIRFSMKVKSGKEVLKLQDIDKAYGEKVILQQTGGTIMRGDKVALIGANGLGKSTLLRIMAQTEPHQGQHELGHQVQPSFFAQHQLEALDQKNNILAELDLAGSGKTEQELRTVLGCFMFSGEDVEKKISVLSGGERSRVALAKTLISEANFLLLDEPTNHLDIQSIHILVQALNAYEGTYVLVSHDRYFLEQVANKIWYIEDQQIKEYPGTYAEYAAWKKRQEAAFEEAQLQTEAQSKRTKEGKDSFQQQNSARIGFEN
ncbi:MAG: ABC-F family ATP-binding cassette domain-containing protein [Bacteroidota bacterium]